MTIRAAGDPQAANFTCGLGRSVPKSGPDPFQLTAHESEKLLRIVSQTLRIKRHVELFQLLQGEVQYFIPHQILISAWGEFGGPNLRLDVISAIPGVRTSRLDGCNVGDLLNELYVRWLAQGRQPVLLSNALNERPTCSECTCALHQALRGMKSALLHGIHNLRDGFDTLYLALNTDAIVRGNSIERFRFLVDPIIAQVDTAFRRVAGLKLTGGAVRGKPPSRSGALSGREEEILNWVSEGRTNAEISEILSISSFTVKNHVQRIMKKLGATNRTEAVAKHRQEGQRARRSSAHGNAVLLDK